MDQSNSGWTVQRSRGTGKVYYFNVRTGASQYTPPPGLAPPEAAAAPAAAAPVAAVPRAGSNTHARKSPDRANGHGRPVDGGKRKSGLLSSLLGSVPTQAPTADSVDARSAHHAGSDTLGSLTMERRRLEDEQRQLTEARQAFRSMVQQICTQLKEEDSAGYHHFDPCERDFRYIIYMVAEEERLECSTFGDGDERYCVVFKASHPPPEVIEKEREEAALLQEAEARREEERRAMREAAKAREAVLAKESAESSGAAQPEAVRVGTSGRKRDRRSIAEIQDDILAKRRRLAEHKEGALADARESDG